MLQTLGVWVLALFGLLVVRTALYGKRWGHGGRVKGALGVILGLALTVPLWRGRPAVAPWLLGAGVVMLLPWRLMGIRLMEMNVRRALAGLARDWGGALEEEGSLFRAHRAAGEDVPEAWAGNVLTRVRSLHPAVQTEESYRMLAFVVRLGREPPVRCSLMKGWSAPKYHRKEWRENTTMQGALMSLSMGDVLTVGGRETGGSEADLVASPDVTDPRFEGFYALLCSDADAFSEVFQGETLEDFFSCAFQTLQFEFNVTPTSVNIYTTYMGAGAIRRNITFLDGLAARLEAV